MTVSAEYRAYIKSPAWQAKRREVFAYHGRRCARCGTRFRLQVNHKTYERLGHERMEDLNILCKKHHPKGRYSASQLASDIQADWWLWLLERLTTGILRGIWRGLRLVWKLLRYLWTCLWHAPRSVD